MQMSSNSTCETVTEQKNVWWIRAGDIRAHKPTHKPLHHPLVAPVYPLWVEPGTCTRLLPDCSILAHVPGLRNPSFHRTGNLEPFVSYWTEEPFLPPHREPGIIFCLYWTEEPFLPPYRKPKTFPVYWTKEPFLPPYRKPGTFGVCTEEPFLSPYRGPGTFCVYWTEEPFLSPCKEPGLRNSSFHHTGNLEPFLSAGLRNPSFHHTGAFCIYWTEACILHEKTLNSPLTLLHLIQGPVLH